MVQTFYMRNGRRDDIVTVKWAVSITGLLVLYAIYTLFPVDIEYDKMEANLEKWRSHGITNYRMRFQINCFCSQDTRRAKIVDVRNGLVHSAIFEDDGTPVSVDDVHSIDSLFVSIKEHLRDIRNSNWYQGKVGLRDLVQADYNAEYGYPELVVFDSDSVTDLYFSYKVELLRIMEEDTDVPVHKAPVAIDRTMYGEMVSIPAGTHRGLEQGG